MLMPACFLYSGHDSSSALVARASVSKMATSTFHRLRFRPGIGERLHREPVVATLLGPGHRKQVEVLVATLAAADPEGPLEVSIPAPPLEWDHRRFPELHTLGILGHGFRLREPIWGSHPTAPCHPVSSSSWS